jgi:HD superfamily phosphodiesterase
MIIDVVRDYTITECCSINNVFGKAFYEEHIQVVIEYGRRLSEIVGADEEIVTIAAYLHDISVVQDIGSMSRHNILGADIAKELLLQNNYPLDRTELVEQTILTHSTPVKPGQGSMEEVCLSNADAMSQITNPVYWLYFAFEIRKLNFEEGKEWLTQKVESNWKGLTDPAKEMIEKEYLLAKQLLKIK